MLENDQLFCYLMVSNLTKRRPKEKNKEKKKWKQRKNVVVLISPFYPTHFFFQKPEKSIPIKISDCKVSESKEQFKAQQKGITKTRFW